MKEKKSEHKRYNVMILDRFMYAAETAWAKADRSKRRNLQRETEVSNKPDAAITYEYAAWGIHSKKRGTDCFLLTYPVAMHKVDYAEALTIVSQLTEGPRLRYTMDAEFVGACILRRPGVEHFSWPRIPMQFFPADSVWAKHRAKVLIDVVEDVCHDKDPGITGFLRPPAGNSLFQYRHPNKRLNISAHILSPCSNGDLQIDSSRDSDISLSLVGLDPALWWPDKQKEE